jgi:hypothetical protein
MTVLVGVSGLADSRDAIQLAFQEAMYRDTDLVALIAYPSQRAVTRQNAASAPPSSPAEGYRDG